MSNSRKSSKGATGTSGLLTGSNSTGAGGGPA